MPEENYRRDYFSISHIIWWFLAIGVAISFALVSWAWCYYVFNFPEKPTNFRILNKLGYIGKVETYTPLDAPNAPSASPQYLFELFSALEDDKIKELNDILIRGYLTNYDKIPVYRYLKGEYRITSVRALSKTDILYPGLLVKARAFIRSGENELSSAYPVIIDYYVPTEVKEAQKNFQEGDLLKLVKSKHCASLLHVAKEGKVGNSTLRCAVIPLAYNIYIAPDRQEIPLHPPNTINIFASLPAK